MMTRCGDGVSFFWISVRAGWLVLLIGCNPPSEPVPFAESLPNGSYLLVEWNQAPYEGVEIQISVDDHAISGRAPINRFRSNYQPDEGRLGPIISTRRAGPPDRMALETDFFSILKKGIWKVDPDGLMVLQNGDPILYFARFNGPISPQ